jgi:Putative MetA-pathway of phenol degradation
VRGRKCSFAIAAGLASMLALAAPSQANAQSSPASQQSAGAAPAVENNGQDFTRPETLFQLRYLYQTAPGSGIVPGATRTVTTDAVILRSDLKVDLNPQWTLALRGDLPFATKDPITSDNPGGGYVYGLGDADVQAALIRTLNARWAAGAGLRIVAPTGSDDLTSGKWQALPIIGARYMLPELSAGSFVTALIRYDASFAGNSSAKNISNLQFAPTLNINFPDRWFITFYPSPDIRINYGDPITGQTGRLFLPLDLMVGRSLTKDITVSLEVGVPMINNYPVYDFKAVTRFNMKF